MAQGIFIGATGQNVGKSTVCLGLIAGLKKRFSSIGFIKPVGQRHVFINDKLAVDKDVVLLKERFGLHIDYDLMSPVIIPSGYTREFLDGKIEKDLLHQKILKSYEKIVSKSEFTVVEGTGHVGVGSIVGLNNAKVASFLGLDMVIIASGGLGSAFDELMINIAMCREYGVKVKGVILNRVIEDKRPMILNYFPKALKELDIPLIGAIPYNNLLNLPSMRDFEILFKSTLISGKEHLYRHFQHTRLVAGSLEYYQEEIRPNQLVITPANREDIIMATLERHLRASVVENSDYKEE